MSDTLDFTDDGRLDVTVEGRSLGTSDGWDQVDDEIMYFYDFRPFDHVTTIPAGDLAWNQTDGTLEVYTDDGINVVFSGDVIDLLKNIKRNEDD